MNYAIELAPFFEDTAIKPPLAQGAHVTHGKNKFTVDRWFGQRDKTDMHCFVFIPLPGTKVLPFAKKPSEVFELIRNNTILVDLWPSPPPNTKPS